MNKIKYGQLNPSIRYVFCKTNSNNDISIQIRVNVGSRDEKNNIHGISHLLEHMFFQGSLNYPSQKQLESEIYNCGGVFNAYTSKESTVFYIDGSKKCLKEFIQIMSDAFFNSLFDKEKLENEKNVVINEINQYLSDPANLSWYGIDELSFKNTRLEKDIVGSEKSVRSITADKMKNYINTHYQKNIIIAVSGNINFDKTYSLIDKYFNHKINYPTDKIISIADDKKRLLYNSYNFKQKKMKLKHIHRNDEQSFITLSFPSYKYSSMKNYTTLLISELLTGYMSSRLYNILRNINGLVYHISTSEYNYEDLGIFYIHFNVLNKKENIIKSIKIVFDTLETLKDDISEEELLICKNNLIENYKSNKNNPNWMCRYATSDLYFLKQIITIDQLIKNILSVTIDDIKKISGEIFKRHLSNICYTSKEKIIL